MNWKFWLGLIISGIFLFWAVRKVDITELGEILRNVKYFYLVPVVILAYLSILLRAYRWYFLLEPVRKISLHSLFSATIIGLMANNLLPARLGEFVRAYVIGHKEKIGKSASFATIVLERIFDGVTILIFLAIVLIFWSSPFPPWLKSGTYVAIGIYFITLFFLILLKLKTVLFRQFIEKMLKPFSEKIRQGVLKILDSFIEGLMILDNQKNIIISSIFSFLIWILPAIMIYLLFISFGIDLPIYASLLLLVILCLGVMIPSAPGFVGTIQFFCIIGLGLFGISKTEALSFSILFHASQYIPVTLMGLVYFFVEGFSFSQISKPSEINKSSQIS
jgi:uncharacterized protein (TIRG00374 family)